MEDYQQIFLFCLIIIGFICFIIGFLSKTENIKKPLYISGGICVLVGLGGILFFPMLYTPTQKQKKRVHFDQEEMIYQYDIQSPFTRRYSKRRSDQEINPSWPEDVKQFIRDVRDPSHNYFFIIRQMKKDIPQMGWDKGTSGHILTGNRTLNKYGQKINNRLLRKIHQNTRYVKLDPDNY